MSRQPPPEKIYTGPDRSTLPEPQTRSQADKYFARVANENILPNRVHKLIGVGGWVVGIFTMGYMSLYADFGKREHVFSPLRRWYHRTISNFITLSPSERRVLGLDRSTGPASVSKPS
ncbi:hypothetical protein M231_06947 [Tremella mesenterica]|uniref:Uncharacterized protein n=1 Tax=Tremella mesenterica TaxID=5217 RepID=A0A4Q1BFX7_TREME|nr:hypothetical protein M231_06947 [Tremella mesenterica]